MILGTHKRMILSDDKSFHQNMEEELGSAIHKKTLKQIKDEYSGCSLTNKKNGTSHLAALQALKTQRIFAGGSTAVF